MRITNRTGILRCCPGAFTLIELIVVVAIIGLLVALILPAVQATRGAARKAHCASNLHQMGIALNAYAAAVGSLPHGANGKKGYSVHSMILGSLDNVALYNSINYMVICLESANITAQNTVLSAFLCPADPVEERPRNSYNANMGYGYQLHIHALDGMFVDAPLAPTSLADVPDGVSNTAMMAESVIGSGKKEIFKPLGSVYRTPTPLTKPQQFEQFITICNSLRNSNKQKFFALKGSSWLRSGYGCSYYNHNLLINQNSCMNHKLFFEGAWTASSFHSAGANVLFADGRVQFVKETVSLSTWRAMGTRAGGEAIPIE